MSKTIQNTLLVIFAMVLLAITIVWVGMQVSPSYGSVIMGNEYNSTTTVRTSGLANLSNLRVLKVGPGSLAQVTITGVGTGNWVLYDATSTVTNTSWATTTIAIFPASTAAGTYTFDAVFYKGLMIEYSGALSTSTITWR